MPRKKRQDRRSVAANVLTLRLDAGESDGLGELVRLQNAKLRELRVPAVVTRASYVRSLINRELESLGMRPAGGDAAAKPKTLVLLPPRKRLRKSIKSMPGPMTIERTVSAKPPKQEHDDKPSPRGLSVWERLRVNLFEDETEKSRRPK